ncbi:MAG: penicillin-binding protein 2 [Candidatus Gastranaerophilales bacterium]|nr:penicillin-binding protein 2 [Candidatus Gastranaerophilales bacterium]
MQSLFYITCFALAVYLFLLQVCDIRHCKTKAKSQRTSKMYVLRGEIVDRYGFKLAADKTTFVLYAHPAYYDSTPEHLAEILSPYVKIPIPELTRKLSQQDKKIITIKKDLDRKTVREIKKKGLRELSYEVKNKRVYPQGTLAAHILGFYNPNADTAGGVEYKAKDYLEYIDKTITYEKSPKGDIIYNLSMNPADVSAPAKGKTLTLTIDSAAQHVCEKYLLKAIQKFHAPRAAAIVMDPTNGEILALAVAPTYNPNEFNKYSMQEIKNWAITDVYPPGSTFKIITVACGFMNKKINKNSRINDTGKMKLGWWDITNYDYKSKGAPGMIDLVYLFEHSSNIASLKIAQMMTSKEFYDSLKLFNFGEKTGIDLPGESAGLLPNPKNWDVATHGAMGYGYGASVTAIQMVSAVSAIANKGVWVTPHVIKYKDPEELAQKVVHRRVLEEQDAKDITQLLVKSIENGKNTAKMDDFYIAAKTGTSRKSFGATHGANKLYTSMIGFFPATNPKAVLYVIVDSPAGEGIWGSTVAAPVFKEISTELVRILNLTPDKQKTKKK